MARPLAVLGCVLASFIATGTAWSQQKPAQRPRKPAATKPAPAPAVPAPAPAPEPVKLPPADVKVVTSYTQAAQVSQNTTYVKGARQRVEFPGVVSIDQCDLQRTVMLSPAVKKYRVQQYAAATAPPATPAPAIPAPDAAAAMMAGQNPPRGGIVTFTTTLTDTLERQTLFGLQARRIKTVVAKQADANACDKSAMRMEIDAWYVDLPQGRASCTRPAAPREAAPPSGGCQDRIEARVAGDVTLGFPVKAVTTTMSGEGDKQEVMSTSTEVTALEITTLDPALFDVPPDYSEATSSAELVPTVVNGGSLQDALFGSTADGTSQAAPKRPGVTRIGVLEPLNKSTRTLNTRMLRQDLAGKFRAPYEALPLSGSSAAAIEADAKRLQCDYILLAEVTEVKTSKAGKMGGLLKMASGGGAPAKESHEIKGRYTLFAADNTAAPRATGDVKASSGSGFGLGSALKVASFAGQMYMGMGMMKGMGGLQGFGLAMNMNPMSTMASMGSLGPMAGSYFDPRAAAMTSMSMTMGAPGMPDQSDGAVYETVSESLDTLAKAATAKIAPAK